MGKNYLQLLVGIVIGLVVGLLLGRFVLASNVSKGGSQQSTEYSPRYNSKEDKKSGAPIISKPSLVNQTIPEKAVKTLNYIKQNGKAPDGYVGGRTFFNRENQLEMTDANGNKIEYQEWDVNPKVQGQNRGAERLVTGSDGRSWYTSDHYKTFTEIE